MRGRRAWRYAYEYVTNILVPTSVHLPPSLLEALDRHARRLGVSRNRVIVRALERELAADTGWSEGFFDALASGDREERELADDMLREVTSRRTSKAAPKL